MAATDGIKAFDFVAEPAISLTEATKLIPGRLPGKRVSIRTLERWARHGCRGVQLEAVWMGSHLCTSIESLRRFFVRLADVDRGITPTPSPLHGGPSHQQARKSLERAGFGRRKNNAARTTA